MYSESPRFEQKLPFKLINKKKPTQGQMLYEHLESTQALWSALTFIMDILRMELNIFVSAGFHPVPNQLHSKEPESIPGARKASVLGWASSY